MQAKIILQQGFIITCFLFSVPVLAHTLPDTLSKKGAGKTGSLSTPTDKEAIRGHFELTEFTMQPGEVDQAVVFRDPAKEQTVLFDLVEGGAIVSFKYNNIEHTWGYNGGGLLQMAFHNHRTDGPWDGDYNPTQAGDGTAMSLVASIGGNGIDTLIIITMMLDFNHNNGFYPNPLLAVWGGRVDDHNPASYFSPYVLETCASWVKNPGGDPKYYLKLDERIIHLTDEKMGVFGFDFADYQKWEFSVRAISPENCPCSSSEVNYIAGGWYTDQTRQVGLAVSMPSNNFPNKKINGGFLSDYMWRNRSFHLSSAESIDGITSKSFVWYVMVGSWDKALQFSKKLGLKGGTK
jgi:hypothetical protein